MGFADSVVVLEEEAAQEIGLNIDMTEALNSNGSSGPPTVTVGDLTELLVALARTNEKEAT